MKILITGGAGFIGTRLTRYLLHLGHSITVLDNFSYQVHGDNRSLPDDLDPHVRLIVGDVADPIAFSKALEGNECVVHLAAETGTGQSMYEVAKYEHTNIAGTALLYELLAKSTARKIERIVVASSRAIYGEGAYRCLEHGLVYPSSRSADDKSAGKYDPVCPTCSGACEPEKTPEDAPLQPSSFYGLTKQVQEQTVLLFGGVLGIPSIALRYQNVYGPGQSLQNPYTGILAIFSTEARAGRPIQIFEDGRESRDFVYIDDVVSATATCAVDKGSICQALNIGSNHSVSVLEVANRINEFYGLRSQIKITGAFRQGDIRHGSADLTKAKSLLGYEPQWNFSDGLLEFLQWASPIEVHREGYESSLNEMRARGLMRG